MIKVDVTRNLIGREDLLLGVGTVQQQRGNSSTIAITKINGSNFPYDETHTMKEMIDNLQLQIDSLPEVVDEDGNLLTGLINTSSLNLNLAGRLWRKTIDANTAEIYYGTELILQYNPASGNLIIPEDLDFIAADAVVTAAFEAADADIISSLNTLEASLGTAALLDVGTSPNNIVQLDGAGKLPAVDGSALVGIIGVPIGGMLFWPGASAPSKFLICQGQAISRTTYSSLFALIGITYGAGDGSTTFNLPQSGGEFIRCLDGGRGVDAGRTLGSAQAEDTKAHSHSAGTLTTSSSGAHNHTVSGEGSSGVGNVFETSSSSPSTTVNTSSNGAHTHTITGSTASSGGAETRPRNIAFNLIMRVE